MTLVIAAVDIGDRDLDVIWKSWYSKESKLVGGGI